MQIIADIIDEQYECDRLAKAFHTLVELDIKPKEFLDWLEADNYQA